MHVYGAVWSTKRPARASKIGHTLFLKGARTFTGASEA
jgi:hypothetical protein